MFKHKQRTVVIPQSEHQRLAGELALLWGNAEFELPPLPRLSVTAGIALHDRAYDTLDNMAIDEVTEDRWLAVTRKGFFMPCGDPIADLITRHHLLRLVCGRPTPSRLELAGEMRFAIQQQIAQHGFDAGLFQQVDRMTELCDAVAFDFCWGEPASRQMEVVTHYASAKSRSVRYQVEGSEIRLDPWPLAVENHTGYLVGYQLEGYPEQADGLLLPYTIRPV